MTQGNEESGEARAEQSDRSRLSHYEQMLDAQSKCVPCKLCGGKAVISDAGPGSGYYISCGNSDPLGRSKGCLISERRLGGWAYNVMDWWNRLQVSATAASPPIIDNGDGVTATFVIRVGPDGSTSMHTRAGSAIPAYLLIDHAIGAILSERADMRKCTVHKEAPPEKPCPFCGEANTYPDMNFSGKAWTTCLNRNCGANAPQEIWNQRALSLLPQSVKPDAVREALGENPGIGAAGYQERLRKAYCVQQPQVPDQSAIVWRSDLLSLFHEYWQLQGRASLATPSTATVGLDSATVEACAKVAEHFAENAYSEGMSEDVVMARSYCASDVATAIRALSPKSQL
jgi:hypothetical protein